MLYKNITKITKIIIYHWPIAISVKKAYAFWRSGKARTKSNRLLDDRLKDDQNRNGPLV